MEKDPVLVAIEEVKDNLKGQLDVYKKELDAKIDNRVKEINEDGTKQGKNLEAVREDVLKEVNKIKGEFDAYRKEAGKFKDGEAKAKTYAQEFREKLHENLESIQKQRGNQEVSFQVKTVQNMLVSATHTGDTGISQIFREQARGYYPWHIRQLVGVTPSEFDTVNYPQAVVPVGEGSFGPQTEGSAKPQVDYDTKIVTLSLAWEAAVAKVSRQSLRNIPFLESYLSNSLTEDFMRREDIKFLNAIATSATAGSTAETVKATKMIDFMVQVENAGYQANAFLTTPAMWAEILKTKPSDYSVPFGYTISPTGDVLVCGLPVYKSPIVSANRVYVGDWSKVTIAQSEGFNIRMTEFDQDDFIKNLVTFRAEAAIGLVEYAPAAFVFGVL